VEDQVTDPRPPSLPDRALFWRWVWSAVRPVVGWLLALLGALALFLGWYGVSGTPLPAKQVPYLLSGGLTGVALIVLAAAFLATDDIRRQLTSVAALEQKVDELYRLLTEAATPAGEQVPSRGDGSGEPAESLLAVDGGSAYHRPSCRLVSGKPSASALSPKEAAQRGLAPCRLCEPPARAGAAA
jgi:hypothetical protein